MESHIYNLIKAFHYVENSELNLVFITRKTYHVYDSRIKSSHIKRLKGIYYNVMD